MGGAVLAAFALAGCSTGPEIPYPKLPSLDIFGSKTLSSEEQKAAIADLSSAKAQNEVSSGTPGSTTVFATTVVPAKTRPAAGDSSE